MMVMNWIIDIIILLVGLIPAVCIGVIITTANKNNTKK